MVGWNIGYPINETFHCNVGALLYPTYTNPVMAIILIVCSLSIMALTMCLHLWKITSKGSTINHLGGGGGGNFLGQYFFFGDPLIGIFSECSPNFFFQFSLAPYPQMINDRPLNHLQTLYLRPLNQAIKIEASPLTKCHRSIGTTRPKKWPICLNYYSRSSTLSIKFSSHKRLFHLYDLFVCVRFSMKCRGSCNNSWNKVESIE